MTSLTVTSEEHPAVGLQRFCVKFFARALAEVDDEKFIEIFHEWIRRQALSGILIDIADYNHLNAGPGIMLISHEANLAMDRADGRLGLSYQRKASHPGTLVERILAAIEVTLTACQLLEQEPLLNGGLKFGGEHFVFISNDRLLAPNDETTPRVLRDTLAAVAARLYADEGSRIEYVSKDPRERLILNIRTSKPAGIETLLENLRRQPH